MRKRPRCSALLVLVLLLGLLPAAQGAEVTGPTRLDNGLTCWTVQGNLKPGDEATVVADTNVFVTRFEAWKQLGSARVQATGGRYLVVQVEGLPLTTMPTVNVGAFRTDVTMPEETAQWVTVGPDTAVIFDLGREAKGIAVFAKVSTNEDKGAAVDFVVYQTDQWPVPGGPSDWALEELERAQSLGFFPQYMQNNYQRSVTRAEFAKVALSFLAMQYGYDLDEFPMTYHDSPLGKDLTQTYEGVNYSDMAGIDDQYVRWATVFNLVKGRGDGTFAPNDPITRQEAAVMLLRCYQRYGGNPGINTKADPNPLTNVPDWAQDAAKVLSSWGVMNGVAGTDRFMNPEEEYSREQCALTFLRLYELMPVSRSQGNLTPMYTYEQELARIKAGASQWDKCMEIRRYEGKEFTLVYSLHRDPMYTYHTLEQVYLAGGRRTLSLHDEGTASNWVVNAGETTLTYNAGDGTTNTVSLVRKAP